MTPSTLEEAECAMPMCPATMCPFMGKDVHEKGSPWTGHHESPCDGDGCGWWQGGGCLVPGDISSMLVHEWDGDIDDVDTTDDDRWVDCEYADDCQWQEQTGERPCPPRLAILLNMDPARCLF